MSYRRNCPEGSFYGVCEWMRYWFEDFGLGARRGLTLTSALIRPVYLCLFSPDADSGYCWRTGKAADGGSECGIYHHEGQCWNREHIWPKSWFGGFDAGHGAQTDLHELWAADGYVNGRRRNYPFCEVRDDEVASYTSVSANIRISASASAPASAPASAYCAAGGSGRQCHHDSHTALHSPRETGSALASRRDRGGTAGGASR